MTNRSEGARSRGERSDPDQERGLGRPAWDDAAHPEHARDEEYARSPDELYGRREGQADALSEDPPPRRPS